RDAKARASRATDSSSSSPPVAATAGSTPIPPITSAASSTQSAPPVQAVERTAAPERLTVGLVARRPVYVSATADGRTVISRLLQPGERTSVDVAREMVLTAGDASALRLTLNGAEARSLGKAGELVSTRLTPANFR